MEKIPDPPALGRALHDLYSALTLVYHEAEGLPRNTGNSPLFAFLANMDDALVGRLFLARHGVSALPSEPEELLAALATALHRYRDELRTEREQYQRSTA